MIAACIIPSEFRGGAGGLAPVANFTYSGFNTVGDTIFFQDLSTNNPTSWVWKWNGTLMSNEQNPSFYFATPGDYLFSLTASNAYGSDTFPMTITANEF